METKVNTGVKVHFQHLDTMKLGCFNGTNYTRWKDRIMCLLTTLNVYYVLDPDLHPFFDIKPHDPAEVKAKLCTENLNRENDARVH